MPRDAKDVDRRRSGYDGCRRPRHVHKPALVHGTHGKFRHPASAARCGWARYGRRGEIWWTPAALGCVALADLFQDQLDSAHAHSIDAAGEGVRRRSTRGQLCLSGLRRAYEQIAASQEVDAIVTHAPYFHPQHSTPWSPPGKHVYLENGGVDVPGAKRVIEIGKRAQASSAWTWDSRSATASLCRAVRVSTRARWAISSARQPII